MLRVQGLSAGYGGRPVVRAVDLEVPDGGVVCLMGRNGAGKTTLLKAIMGLLPPDGGRVEVDGVDLTRRPAYERARHGVSYVPQGRGIFPYLSVYENLLMGFEGSGGRVDPSALEEVLDLFPALRPILSKPGGVLSGGQQQQLAIARALVGRPRLLLLDEPTEGIQPSIVQQIGRVLQNLKGQRALAILLVEQFVDFAVGVADAYAVMDRGEVVAKGPVSDLDREAVRAHLAV